MKMNHFKKSVFLAGFLMGGALILWPTPAAQAGSQGWTATSIDCSFGGLDRFKENTRYQVIVDLVQGSTTQLEAIFWKSGYITLSPDQKDVPTTVDTSTPIPVTVTVENGVTYYVGEGFSLTVQAAMVLPNPDPQLTPDGSSQMLYSAVLNSVAERVKGMPAQHNVQLLNNCVYSIQ